MISILASLRYLLSLPVWLLAAMSAHASSLTLDIADIEAASFSARGIHLDLPPTEGASLALDELRLPGRTWRNLKLHCKQLELSSSAIACRQGTIAAQESWPIDLRYELATRQLTLSLDSNNEHWRLKGKFDASRWQLTAQLSNAQARRLAAILPDDAPAPSQGRISGQLALSGDPSGLRSLETDLQLDHLAFSDQTGLHAAEGLGGNLQLSARRNADRWDWRGDLLWQSGELFWQPLYLRGGHHLHGSGSLQDELITVTQASLDSAEVGELKISGVWNQQRSALETAHLHGEHLALGPLFAAWLQPFLEKSVLGAATLSGHADLDWRYRAGATEALQLKLHDADITDSRQRYTLHGLNAAIPWLADGVGAAQVSWRSGELLHVPLGAAQLDIAMRGMEFTLPAATLPILDGRLALRDFHLHQENDAWHWNFAGALSPIDMRALTHALGLPQMHGALSGMIPQVSYRDGLIKVDGALLFRVFDGTVVANRLELADAFGRTPRLSGNLDMRAIDLDLLTRTFSFGNMQGKLDVSVNNLELADWQPVRFDARLASSPGRYRKKISQKAVENISALGGSGAAAALQRTYLGVFENFGYDRIGLSCILRNGVCAMDGVARRNGGYIIVQGGGIPAITVMGYNRAVGWDELLSRLKRVMQDNVQAVVE